MAAADYPGAVRAGTMAAARLHQRLDLRQQIEARGGNVDVFAAVQSLDLPLLLRPLQGLLGAYLSEPTPGVLITTQRPMSIQRFTAAHELGHLVLHRHGDPKGKEVEQQANEFAGAFLLPEWRAFAGASDVVIGTPMLRIASRKRGYEIRYALGYVSVL